MHIPDFCFTLNNMTINPETGIGKIIIIKALEEGYYPTSDKGTQEKVDELNENMGVDSATASAMQTASMFGWHCYKKSLEAYSKSKIK